MRGAGLVMLAAAVLLVGCGDGDDDVAEPATTQRVETEALTPTPSDAPVPARGAPVVAALGDSITAGTPLWDPDPEVRELRPDAINPMSQYEYWAQARLGARVRFRNCGVNRQRTDEIAERYERCTRGAKAVVIQGGINDIAQGAPPASAARNLDALVRRARGDGLGVVMVEVLPWNNGFPDAVEPIKELNRRIAAIGRQRGVAVLPFYATLEDPRAPGNMRGDDTLDGDHPNVLGYRKLGVLVAATPAVRDLAMPRG